MTCGVPVVATAVNSVPEMVVPGRTGLLVPPEDPIALATAIGYLLDHPDEAARLAANATAHLGDSFTPGALGRDVTAAYEHVLAARRALPARRNAGAGGRTPAPARLAGAGAGS
jgi:glycosyltransferase involved in cell wall biosynthesis